MKEDANYKLTSISYDELELARAGGGQIDGPRTHINSISKRRHICRPIWREPGKYALRRAELIIRYSYFLIGKPWLSAK